VPQILVGTLLAQRHLLGHQGLAKMLQILDNFYFPQKSNIVKNFVQGCYSCFMSNPNTKKSKIGVYPIPSYAMEELQLDLAENLIPSSGFQHLLVAQCSLSGFLIIIPLKSKTATAVSQAIFSNILQIFKVKRLHSDNGPCFRDREFLKLMSAIGVKIIGSAALHPEGRGQIERSVGIVKLILKKLLATRKTYAWDFLPYMVSKIYNSTPSMNTGVSPNELVFGKFAGESPFLEHQGDSAIPHYLVKNEQVAISELTAEIKTMTMAAQEKIFSLKLKRNENLNKNRTSNQFRQNDIVFSP
jgi:hypothetical protein